MNSIPNGLTNVFRVLVVLWLVFRAEVGVAQQPAADEARYTFAFVGVPLATALGVLMAQSPIQLFFESDLVANQRAYCRIEQGPAEDVLRCLLHQTDLDFYRLSSGTYVLTPRTHTEPRYGSLLGQVVDAETGAPLADASVVLWAAQTGTATNRAGRFAFAHLEPGAYRVVVTHIAYEDAADTLWVAPGRPPRTPVRLALAPRTIVTTPMVVNGLARRLPSAALGSGRRGLQQSTPPVNVVRDLESIVGVQVGDALADVHLQGGASGEHEFLLDGTPVFVPIQNGGFVGPFSPFALKQITVHKAGFEAGYGSHLAGVVAVEHDAAPPARPTLVVQADPLNVSGRVHGAFGTKQHTHVQWMLAGRQSLWAIFKPEGLHRRFRSWSQPDLFLLQALQPDTPLQAVDTLLVNTPIEIGYSDIHATLRAQFGGLRSLYASFYRGHNVFGNEVLESERTLLGTLSDEYTWTNRTAQVRYEWVQGSRAFGYARLWGSDYRLDHPFDRSPLAGVGDADPADQPNAEFNHIQSVGVRTGVDVALTHRHTLKGTLALTYTDSDFALTIDPTHPQAVASPDRLRPIAWQAHAVLEDAFALTPKATLTAGTRLSYLPAQRRVFAEPRLSFRYDVPSGPGGAWAFRGATGLYRQFMNQFDVASYSTSALLPRFRFWMPVGQAQRPPTAYHLAGDVLYMPTPAWTLGLEGYYKHHPQLAVLNYGNRTAEVPEVLARATGYAYGLGLTLRRAGTRIQGEASYEYAVARRRIANRFDGRLLAAPWQTPHQVRLALDVVPAAGWTATLRWRAVWGRSWGFRRAYYDYLALDPAALALVAFDFNAPDTHTLPAFSQVDAGLAYARTLGRLGLQVRLTLTNALGRRNVLDWSLALDPVAGRLKRLSRVGLPFVPLLSLRVDW